MSSPMFGLQLPPSTFTPQAPVPMPIAAEVPPQTFAPPAFQSSPMGVPAPTQMMPPEQSMPAAPPPLPPRRNAQQPGQPPSFLQAILPVAAAVLAGGRDPRAIAAGLTAFQRGRRNKLALEEDEIARTQREEMERADFYGRAMQEAATITDPVHFQQWRNAIAPMAELYDVPMESFVFNNTGSSERTRAMVQKALDSAVKSHGAAILDRDDVSIRLADGRTLPMRDARALRDGDVIGPGGTPVAMPAAKKEPIRVGQNDRLVDPETHEVLVDAAAGGGAELPNPLDQRAAAILDAIDAAVMSGDDAALARLKGQYANILKAKGDVGKSDDVNRGGGRMGDPIEVRMIAAAFDNSPIVKNFNELQSRAATMNAIVKSGRVSGPTDIALIFDFMKALDPTSVVREQEYATAAKAGNLFLGAMARFNGSWFSESGGILPEAVRQDFLRTIRVKFEAATAQYQNQKKEYGRRIDQIRAGGAVSGIEALTSYENAIPDVFSDAGLPSSSRAPATASSAPDLKGLQPGKQRRFTQGPFAGQVWTIDATGTPKKVQ